MSASNRMAKQVNAYLAMRRAFGFQPVNTGHPLRSFARFADKVAAGQPLTVELALRWAQASRTGKPTTAACRLTAIRPFTRYMQTIDPRTEVPPFGLLGRAQHRFDPHIYTDEEIRILLGTATCIESRGGLNGETFAAYIGLLASTGMRPSEPLRLARTDVDLKAQIITVRRAKFSKSRIVALHSTATKALVAYSLFRERCVPRPGSNAFFLLDGGTALTHGQALRLFVGLRRQLGWGSLKPAPRLYDLRHTFVCRRLLDWYRQGLDVQVMVPALSTYLGHAQVTHTYWYVTGILELMEIANTRFESFLRQEGQ